ncbi:hypothetical protein NUW54_g9264 [Trametes sanguinea]|uniref:Uncharacterized protein n=1 Tax=Trametes sanguinea TaxID=158606 RepID=A0ACC1P7S9_9APHY|nr:hypothetical protein NUW54_g9264 [Trametes sanguinea]
MALPSRFLESGMRTWERENRSGSDRDRHHTDLHVPAREYGRRPPSPHPCDKPPASVLSLHARQTTAVASFALPKGRRPAACTPDAAPSYAPQARAESGTPWRSTTSTRSYPTFSTTAMNATDFKDEKASPHPGWGEWKKRDVEAPTIQVETHDIFEDDSGVDPVYQAKARILNDAIQEIGMVVSVHRRRIWMVLITYRPIVTGLILDPVVNEFHFQGPFLKLGQNIGLLVGAAFWGVASDVWGRKWCFNIILFITGVFAIAAGGSPNYIALCSLAAVWSVGVGGNLPVDSAVFLEFIPASHQYLLTILSIWWAFGQLVGSLVCLPLLAPFVTLSHASPVGRLASNRRLLLRIRVQLPAL